MSAAVAAATTFTREVYHLVQVYFDEFDIPPTVLSHGIYMSLEAARNRAYPLVYEWCCSTYGASFSSDVEKCPTKWTLEAVTTSIPEGGSVLFGLKGKDALHCVLHREPDPDDGIRRSDGKSAKVYIVRLQLFE